MARSGSSPRSLVAERAVRYLERHAEPIASRRLAREILSTAAPSEETATEVLRAAFRDDGRLVYGRDGWRRREAARRTRSAAAADRSDPDVALVLLDGGRSRRGAPFRLTHVLAVRVEDRMAVRVAGGDVAAHADDLRAAILEILGGTTIVAHDPPGALPALERWLGVPAGEVVSLRRLGQIRLRLPAGHDLAALAGRLGIAWRDTGDPLDLADALDACLQALRRDGESLSDLARESRGPEGTLDWSRFGFDRDFLAKIPTSPGVYRFYDIDGTLLYVGKSRNLRERVNSYFYEGGRRSDRARKIVERVHRIEFEPLGSDLEAVLREAETIRRRRPSDNVQRRVHPKGERSARLRSILILEPAAPPLVLRAYLVRDGRMVDRVGVGPRGGGLLRIRRALEDRFFSAAVGPTAGAGPEIDVELVARWLSANRDRVVAFDPTDLASAEEVVERLRWYLTQSGPLDPDGSPVHRR